MQVWERGAGLTLACGTGACATAVACASAGYTGRNVEVKLKLGSLHIDWRDDSHVYMTGPATKVYSGQISLEAE